MGDLGILWEGLVILVELGGMLWYFLRDTFKFVELQKGYWYKELFLLSSYIE